MVRDRRCQTLKGIVAVFFFEHLTLEADLIDMLGHIEEVYRNCWVIEVFYLRSPYHRVVCNVFWLLSNAISTVLPIRRLPLGLIDLTVLLIQLIFCLVDHTVDYSVKAYVLLYLKIRGIIECI